MDTEENNISQNIEEENEKEENSSSNNNEKSIESNKERIEKKEEEKIEKKEENSDIKNEEKKEKKESTSKLNINPKRKETSKLSTLERYTPIKTEELNKTINSEKEKSSDKNSERMNFSPSNISLSEEKKSKKNSFAIANKKKESSFHLNKPTQKISQNSLKENLSNLTPIQINTSLELRKNLDETLSQIKNEINSENKLIDEIDFKLNEISQNNLKHNKNNILYKLSNEKTNKMLNKLNSHSNHLQYNINSLNKIQLKLENESYMFIPNDSSKKMREEKLRQIKNQKLILMSKLNDINTQINNIVEKENINKSKSILIKNFLDNFETDKEKFSNAMIAISKEVSKRRKERHDLRIKEDEENEKKYKEQLLIEEHEKEIKKKEFIKNQKELEGKIKEKKIKIMDKSKPYLNCCPSLKDKNYITAEERENIRKEKEEELISLELAKRKNMYKPINIKELDEFSKQVIENEKKTMAELEKKKIQLNALYKEREELLPKYHSKFYTYNLQNENDLYQKEQNRINEINIQKQKRKKFDKEVKKYYFPKKIDEKLKKQREEIISNLNGENRYENIRKLNSEIQKSAQKYKVPKMKLKLKEGKNIIENNIINNNNNNIYKNVSRNNRVIKMPQIETSINKDYLTEIREKRELKNQKLSKSVDNSTQWEKMLNNNKNNRNLFDNIYDVRVQADKMHKEATFKSKLLNIDDTSRKFPGIRNEIANLFVGSIQAKIEILKSLKSRTIDNQEKN